MTSASSFHPPQIGQSGEDWTKEATKYIKANAPRAAYTYKGYLQIGPRAFIAVCMMGMLLGVLLLVAGVARHKDYISGILLIIFSAYMRWSIKYKLPEDYMDRAYEALRNGQPLPPR